MAFSEERPRRRDVGTIGDPSLRLCDAPPLRGATRASRRRHLPTNHGHAALPSAIRVYQPDSSSKTPLPPPHAAALRNYFDQGGPDPPNHSLDDRSFHISRKAAREDRTR